MFPEGSKEERAYAPAHSELAAPLKAAAFRISISDHTSATRLPARPGYGPWELSGDRANAVRKLIEADGVPTSHVYMVAGRADTQPLFLDDPLYRGQSSRDHYVMREAPPIPPNFKP
jgi:chemotaxis protein MotB